MVSDDIKYNNLKFLIVDDMLNMRKTIRNMLQLLDVNKTVEAENGTAALRKLREDGNIDFVICDWNMPSLSGIELLEVMKNMPEYRSLPFLMVTAEMGEDRIAQAAETEVDGYIIKPFVARILEQKIIDILRRKLNPTEEQLAVEHVLDLKDAKKYDQAVNYLKSVLEKKPNSARIQFMIGDIYESTGNSVTGDKKEKCFNIAEEWYQKAKQSNPQYIKVHQALGDFYEKKGDVKKALASLESAAKISPYNPSRMIKIGEINLDSGNAEKAEKAFKTLDTIQSTKKADSLKEVGELYLKHGHPEKAEKIFKDSLKEKEDPLVYNRLGIALRKQGKAKEAISLYQKALAISPDNEGIYYNLGKAYLEIGDKASAKVKLQKAVSLDPEFEEAIEELENLQSV